MSRLRLFFVIIVVLAFAWALGGAANVQAFEGSLSDEIRRIDETMLSTGANPAAQRDSETRREAVVSAISVRYRIAREKLERLFLLLSPGNVTAAFVVAEKAGAKRQEILQLRLDGMAWGDILDRTGVEEDSVARGVRALRRDLGC